MKPSSPLELISGQSWAGGQDVAGLRERLSGSALPAEARLRIQADIDRLAYLPGVAGDVAATRAYIDLVLSLPWQRPAGEEAQLAAAQARLDEGHYGHDDVKEHVLAYLAAARTGGTDRRPPLCLVGPPGVGKTSLGKTIARALGRPIVQIALGGVADGAAIRGHRRAYAGAQPGRIIQGIQACGARNPVILLDQIDRMSQDPRSDAVPALLEALDPEQNSLFRDHYLELAFDLSDVLFVATATDPGRIPASLRERLELVYLTPYADEEKCAIARQHLLPRELAAHGLSADHVTITDEALVAMIRSYTREPGVNDLVRKVAQICRKALRGAIPGNEGGVTVTSENLAAWLGNPPLPLRSLPDSPQAGACLGLSVSEAGGSVTPFEVACLPGSGRLIYTGNLGESMRESAQAALSWIRANAGSLGLSERFYEEMDIHLHIPGHTLKNGGSAGLPIVVAMVSALLGRPVPVDLAFTGDVTLLGRVLPVGGVRDKVLASLQEGLRRVILPAANVRDVQDVLRVHGTKVEVVAVSTIREAIDYVFAS